MSFEVGGDRFVSSGAQGDCATDRVYGPAARRKRFSSLTLERVMLRATMDISAHAISSRPLGRVSRIDLTTSSQAPHFARPL
jgi:hypothetical protein